MNRRTLVGGFALGMLVPRVAGSQQKAGRVARIGYLAVSEGPNAPGRTAFRDGLRELGWVEGQNLVIELRIAGGKGELLSAQAAELVRLELDVLVGATGLETQALMRATKTIPVVFAASSEPVETGLVASLARPGGNVTGSSTAFADAFSGKWVELLKEATPKATRVAVLVRPTDPRHVQLLTHARLAARPLSVGLEPYDARGPDDFESAYARMARDRVDGLIVFPAGIFGSARVRLVELAAMHRLPAMYEHRLFTEAGGLLSYGPNILTLYRRAAFYVDKILKGAKPADLPVEQPTKFELVINLKTAKALGLTIPPSLLARADELIQ